MKQYKQISYLIIGMMWLLIGCTSKNVTVKLNEAQAGRPVAYTDVTWQRYRVPGELFRGQFSTAIEDEQGEIWFLYWDTVVSLNRDSGKWTVRHEEGEQDLFMTSRLTGGKNNQIWIGDFSWIATYNTEDEVWDVIPSEDPRLPSSSTPNAFIFAFHQDSQGYLWLSTGDTLYRLTDKSDTWEIFPGPDGSPIPWGGFVFVDSRGWIWVESDVYILHNYRPESETWHTYYGERVFFEENEDPLLSPFYDLPLSSTPDLTAAKMLNIAEDAQGRIWVATPLGVSVYDPQADSWQRYTTTDHELGEYIYGVATSPGGQIWVIADAGLFLFRETNDGEFLMVPLPSAFEDLQGITIFTDSKGNVWLSAGLGWVYTLTPPTENN